MAARADELALVTPPSETPGTDWVFNYYADASVIKANITAPTVINNDDTSLVEISGEDPDPGYLYKATPPLPAKQAILTFTSGSAQVSTAETAAGYTTTASATIHGLSMNGILTADVVMGVISTVYPEGNAVPSVSFAGSYFQNLRIYGQVVQVNTNPAIFGPYPPENGSYFDDPAVSSMISQQYYAGLGNRSLPASAESVSNWTPDAADSDNLLECSLVTGASGLPAPASAFGNILVVPNLGTISLGNLRLKRTPNPASPGDYTYKFGLDMICAKLQGTASGRVRIITLDTNGKGHPSPPPPPPPPTPQLQKR